MPDHSEQRRDPGEVDTEVRALIERRVKKSKTAERVIGLVATFAVAGSIGAMGLVVSVSAGRSIAKSERALCHRVLDDRLETIQVREVQAVSAQAVADDPFQSTKTRRARLREARRLQVSIDDLRTRADPANGGSLDCRREFPDPSLF